MGVSKNRGFSPQIFHLNRFSHCEPSILGYPYFWKPPYPPFISGPDFQWFNAMFCGFFAPHIHLFCFRYDGNQQKYQELLDLLACRLDSAASWDTLPYTSKIPKPKAWMNDSTYQGTGQSLPARYTENSPAFVFGSRVSFVESLIVLSNWAEIFPSNWAERFLTSLTL